MPGAPHRFILVVLLVLVAGDARAQQVGVVSFANSGAAAAQESFLYGLAQLHNFEYVDAAALYGLALLGSAHAGRDTAIYAQAASALEGAFATHPNHPGVAHYLIHSYDDPEHARLGLPAARRYSGIAPSAPHALHMTS